MNVEKEKIAQTALDSAYDGRLSFPEIIGLLAQNGFEGYLMDFRAHQATYYASDGDTASFPTPASEAEIGEDFDVAAVKTSIQKAQANGANYTYRGFVHEIKSAGCAGYIVSIAGERVVYFGRTAEMHTEHFPK